MSNIKVTIFRNVYPNLNEGQILTKVKEFISKHNSRSTIKHTFVLHTSETGKKVKIKNKKNLVYKIVNEINILLVQIIKNIVNSRSIVGNITQVTRHQSTKFYKSSLVLSYFTTDLQLTLRNIFNF